MNALRNQYSGMAVLTMLTGLLPLASEAADYPTKPIRLIVPAAPGGGPDIQARLIASELTKQMGHQVVVDNRPGGYILGYELIARAASDGYNFGMLSNSFTTNPSVIAKLPYDTFKDFQPIVLQGSAPFLITVTPSLPIRSVKELIAHARANPGKLSYGSTGMGATGTLSMELFKVQTGSDILGVQYKSTQQAITETIAGQINIACENTMLLLPHVRSGRLRALGITSLKRTAVAPELPTIDESGLPNYEVAAVAGYAAPSRVSREVVMRLNAEINKALQVPAVAEKFTSTGVTILGGTPEQYAEHIRTTVAKWIKVVKAAGIQPQ